MRIGINALFLQKPATGMGQHLLHLLQGLDALDDKDQQYMLLAPRFRRARIVKPCEPRLFALSASASRRIGFHISVVSSGNRNAAGITPTTSTGRPSTVTICPTIAESAWKRRVQRVWLMIADATR